MKRLQVAKIDAASAGRHLAHAARRRVRQLIRGSATARNDALTTAAHPFWTASPLTLPALHEFLCLVKEEGPVGDYFEFGLYRGFSFWFAQSAAGTLGFQDMNFWGFDSFRGLPPIHGLDTAAGATWFEGQFACSMEDVLGNLDRHGVRWDRTHLVPGLFDDLQDVTRDFDDRLHHPALVLIDCDLYVSTTAVLDYLSGHLQDGTIVAFDDWNCFSSSSHLGQRRAMKEFQDRHRQWRAEPISYEWHGAAFRMHRVEGRW